MYAEVKYKSESTNNITVELFKMKQDNPTKQDFLNILDESKKVTGVSRVLLDFRLVDPKNNDVVEWLQKASPCMGHGWINWPHYREQMEDFKKRGVKAVQA